MTIPKMIFRHMAGRGDHTYYEVGMHHDQKVVWLGFVTRNIDDRRLWDAWTYGHRFNIPQGKDHPSRRDAALELWIKAHDAYHSDGTPRIT